MCCSIERGGERVPVQTWLSPDKERTLKLELEGIQTKRIFSFIYYVYIYVTAIMDFQLVEILASQYRYQLAAQLISILASQYRYQLGSQLISILASQYRYQLRSQLISILAGLSANLVCISQLIWIIIKWSQKYLNQLANLDNHKTVL